MFKRAFRNRDCDVQNCLYRLKLQTEGQQLFLGVAFAVEQQITGEPSKYYLLTCNNVKLKTRGQSFFAVQYRKPFFSFRKNKELRIDRNNYFLKDNFCFLTPPNAWKPQKSLRVKACPAENPPVWIKSLIIKVSRRIGEIYWKRNTENEKYQPEKSTLLEDDTFLGSPVLWRDSRETHFCVMGVFDKDEIYFPRLFVDLEKLGKFVVIYSFVLINYTMYHHIIISHPLAFSHV